MEGLGTYTSRPAGLAAEKGQTGKQFKKQEKGGNEMRRRLWGKLSATDRPWRPWDWSGRATAFPPLREIKAPGVWADQFSFQHPVIPKRDGKEDNPVW